MIAKACIFDFDGVVLDSEKYHHMAWEKVAKAIGTTISYDEYQPFKSAGRQVVIPYLLKKAQKENTPEVYNSLHNLRSVELKKTLALLTERDITAGFLQFIEILHKNGIPCAVASSSRAAHDTAQRFGLLRHFDAFVDGNAQLPNKPQPHLFLRAAQLLGVPPQQCVVFEDSINGLLAAKNANMHCVGIKTHFTNVADKIIDDFCGATMQLLQFEDKT